jgi:hypothetical protein
VTFALALPVAASENVNYKDKFDSIGWGGSNGSLNWSGPWQEIGDDGDEKFGSVRVVSSGSCPSGGLCMRISATLILTDIGAKRRADTSVLQEPELCFDVVNVPDALSLPGTKLRIQVNAGSGWTTIDEYDLGDEFEDHPTFDIADFRSEDFQVRFLVVGLLSTSQVFIDNVEITGEVIETTTTTTAPATTSTTEDDDGPSSTTTTTRPDTSTTTTVRATTTTRPAITTIDSDDETSTTTTLAGTTTTTASSDDDDSTLVAIGAGEGGGSDGGPPGSGGPEGSGIRQTARGLQANFDGGLFGEVSPISPITGVDFQARFSMAVEMIEASWVWIVLLSLVIAWSIVTGMDRRRSQPLG